MKRSPRPSTWLALLRDLVPMQALPLFEHRMYAERQADYLLLLGSSRTPPVPTSLISDLPKLLVARRTGVAADSLAWQRGRWVLSVRAGDALERQRFSLAHQL